MCIIISYTVFGLYERKFIELQMRKHHNIKTKQEKIEILQGYANKYNLKFDGDIYLLLENMMILVEECLINQSFMNKGKHI